MKYFLSLILMILNSIHFCLNSKECKVVVPNKTKIGKLGQTVIGYYFCEESIPYRISITGDNVTLGQLKQAIGKKGNFRFEQKSLYSELVYFQLLVRVLSFILRKKDTKLISSESAK